MNYKLNPNTTLALKAYPEELVEVWCSVCLNNIDQAKGILFSVSGIEIITICPCGNVTIAAETNPLDEINKKLDRLLSHLGIDLK
jgi:hypothetical protein